MCLDLVTKVVNYGDRERRSKKTEIQYKIVVKCNGEYYPLYMNYELPFKKKGWNGSLECPVKSSRDRLCYDAGFHTLPSLFKVKFYYLYLRACKNLRRGEALTILKVECRGKKAEGFQRCEDNLSVECHVWEEIKIMREIEIEEV